MAMSTVVTIDEERRSRLAELQDMLERETGKRVTQQEIVSELIDVAYESRKDLIDSFLDETASLSEEEIEEFLSGTFSSDNPVVEEDIDDVLYDNEQFH